MYPESFDLKSMKILGKYITLKFLFFFFQSKLPKSHHRKSPLSLSTYFSFDLNRNGVSIKHAMIFVYQEFSSAA